MPRRDQLVVGAARSVRPVTSRTPRPAGRLAHRVNDFWRDFGYHHGRTTLRNHPRVYAVEATNHCNLRCVMCPRGEPDLMERPLGSMSDEVLERVLDDARFFADPCWFHWFGEPLMHPRLFEHLDLVKSRGVPNLGISTNATLLDDRRRRALLDSPLDTLMIAIDGTDAATYERIRLSDRHEYEEVVENARSFLALRRSRASATPRTVLSIIVMRQTEPQLAEFREQWMEAGADDVVFKPFTTWGGQTGDFTDLDAPTVRARFGAGRANPCSFLWEGLVIAWNGLVVPCCFDYDAKEVLGDLTRQSLAEIWNGEPYQRLRRDERDGCNDSALCAGCNEAPGQPRNPLWPLPYRRSPR